MERLIYMQKFISKNISYLIFVIVLGAMLRFSYLTYNPPSLNWDEVSYGYNAYSIIKTGADQWGQKFPILNFRAYGDYPTTLNLYLTIPFIVVFGLTEFAIRFPHALMGILTIASVYFLAFGVTKKHNISLLASFLVAISPWYVFTSRFVIQSNLSVFLLITAAALFFNREKSKYFLPLSLFSLTLSLFSYHTTRIFSPLIVLATLFVFRQDFSKKVFYIFISVFMAISAFILINPESRARASVLFLVDQGVVNRIIESRNLSKLPEFAKRLVYNRPLYFAGQFAKNYISYFSPQFLFFNGGTQYQFSIPNTGLIYWINLPFFYIGLIILIGLAFKERNYRLLLLWLILSPIPASITNESYAVLRATTMLPIPEILISIGLFWCIDKLPKTFHSFALPVYYIVLFIFLENYLFNYFTNYRVNYSWSWQYGYKEVVNYVDVNYSKYDKIIVTKKYGEPHEYFLFFLKYDPYKYQNDSGAIKFFQSNWYWIDKFDKFYFMNDWQIPKESGIMKLESGGTVDCSVLTIHCLLITSPGDAPNGWNKVDEIKFLNGGTAFELYVNN